MFTLSVDLMTDHVSIVHGGRNDSSHCQLFVVLICLTFQACLLVYEVYQTQQAFSVHWIGKIRAV